MSESDEAEKLAQLLKSKRWPIQDQLEQEQALVRDEMAETIPLTDEVELLADAKRKTLILAKKVEELKVLLQAHNDLLDATDALVSETLTLLRDKLKAQKREGKF